MVISSLPCSCNDNQQDLNLQIKLVRLFPIYHRTGKHASNARGPPFILISKSVQTLVFAEITVRVQLYRKKIYEQENGSYLDEFGRREDGLVGHGGRRYYNRGIVFLLQPLIEHLHMEKTQEAKSAKEVRRVHRFTQVL